MSELKHTPLYGFHQDHGARLVPFAGWEMPVQYTSILEEHRAVREAAGLFDVSHMGEALVSGPQAEEFLDYLLPNKIKDTPIGKGVYSPMCHPNGGVVDDL
ncbi:MAG: glycine cleavage system aminomethyltransferase GcvT, partial [Puniceicoccales bacterium]